MWSYSDSGAGKAALSANATAWSTRATVASSSCSGLALLEHALAQQPLGERVDRVALAPLGDLLLRAVLLRVGHRVAAEAVGDGLDEDRLPVLARAPDRLAHHVVGLDHVHAVAAQAGYAEALAAAVQVGHRGVALDRGPHAELVVGDHEDDRQLPEGGEVERLAERALVGGAVAEHAQRDLVEALVVGGERHAGGERQVAADDPVAAHEAVLEVEHVHRAAAAVRDAVLAAEQLGHHAVGIGPAGQRVAVRAVGRDQVVLVAQRAAGADDRRLLADRQVQEAADLGLRVHLPRALLEAADRASSSPATPSPRRGRGGPATPASWVTSATSGTVAKGGYSGGWPSSAGWK